MHRLRHSCRAFTAANFAATTVAAATVATAKPSTAYASEGPSAALLPAAPTCRGDLLRANRSGGRAYGGMRRPWRLHFCVRAHVHAGAQLDLAGECQ